MNLDKSDLKEFKKIVKEEITESEKRITKKIDDKVDDAVELLAGMSKREFDANSLDHTKIRADIANLNFRSTETVTRPEFFQLKEKVNKIGVKAGIR